MIEDLENDHEMWEQNRVYENKTNLETKATLSSKIFLKKNDLSENLPYISNVSSIDNSKIMEQNSRYMDNKIGSRKLSQYYTSDERNYMEKGSLCENGVTMKSSNFINSNKNASSGLYDNQSQIYASQKFDSVIDDRSQMIPSVYKGSQDFQNSHRASTFNNLKKFVSNKKVFGRNIVKRIDIITKKPAENLPKFKYSGIYSARDCEDMFIDPEIKEF